MDLVKECLPFDAFYGRGKEMGPEVFLTDNNNEERAAVSNAWPTAFLALCLFHVMEAVWRWLFDKKNGIREGDRQLLIWMVKEIAYSDKIDEAESTYRRLVNEINGLPPHYSNFRDYFDKFVWVNEQSWCKAYLSKLPMRGNTTQNYVESQFRVIKDEILHRVQGYNLNEVIDIMVEQLEYHFQDKTLSVSNGSFDGIFSSRFKGLSVN